jgi:hypothetical protein
MPQVPPENGTSPYNGTYPYNGGPSEAVREVIPPPRDGDLIPAKKAPPEGSFVSLPTRQVPQTKQVQQTTPRYTYAAYGEQPTAQKKTK